MRLTNVCRTPDNLVSIRMYLEQFSKGFDECRALQTECSVGIVALSVITVRKYSWISWCILPWELEGIKSPCCLLIGQYPHHMTLCPPVAIVKRCYGFRL